MSRWAALFAVVSLACIMAAADAQADTAPMCTWKDFVSTVDTGETHLASASFGLAAYHTVYDSLTNGTPEEKLF